MMQVKRSVKCVLVYDEQKILTLVNTIKELGIKRATSQSVDIKTDPIAVTNKQIVNVFCCFITAVSSITNEDVVFIHCFGGLMVKPRLIMVLRVLRAVLRS